MENEKALLVYAAIMEMAVEALESGISTDELMNAKLNPLGIFSVVNNMSALCLNRQRAVWLTHGDRALSIHQNFCDKRKAEALSAIKKKEVKLKKTQLDSLVVANSLNLDFIKGIIVNYAVILQIYGMICRAIELIPRLRVNHKYAT